MALDADPYRTLGLPRDASLDEVKRAYRRLAKANHPDAAGEAALPRFLAIQAAYDQIAGPDTGVRRPGGGAAAGQGSRSRRAWEADPDRAGATRRAYGGRTRPRPGPRARPAGEPPPEGRRERADRPPRPERPPNKATLGSTSYDGADAEPMDPDWGGASWYGTSSGTYWTLNPKEYADPRKHGPEYQARARRARERRSRVRAPGSETLASGEAVETDATAGASMTDDASTASETGPAGPTHTASSWWAPDPMHTAAERASTPPRSAPRPRPVSRATPPSAGAPAAAAGVNGHAADDGLSSDAILDGIRGWLDDRNPGVGARIGRAVIGWAPIALGIGWFAGEITGCSRFSAVCHPSVAPATWIAQLAILVLLILVTRLARITTVATIATLAAIFPASALLLATFDPDSMTAGRTVLGGLMAAAWVAGIAYGALR